MKSYAKLFSLLLFFLLTFQTVQSQVVRVINNRVGVLTNSPSYPLHVNGDMYGNWIRTAGQRGLYSQTYGLYVQAISASYWASRSDRGLIFRNRGGTTRGYVYHNNSNGFGLLDGDGNWSIRNERDSWTQFAINNISRMRLYSSGRLDVETNRDASGTSGSGSLQIAGNLRLDNNEMITNTNGTLYLQHDNNGDLRVDNSTLWVDASANQIRTPFIYDSNNTAYYLNPNSISRMNYVLPSGDNQGWCGTSSSTWNYGYFRYLYRQNEYTLSDRRAKENIRGITNALGKVLALSGKIYNYKNSVNEGQSMLDFDRTETVAPSNGKIKNTNTAKAVDHKVEEGQDAPDAIVLNSEVQDEILVEQEEILPEADLVEVQKNQSVARNRQNSANLGFIAQEVQSIVPEAVTYDAENDVYSMSYTAIIPLLVEGMKEQQKMIENQQKEIEQLKLLIEQE